MVLVGSFRVCDTWQGVSKENKPRASVTLIDTADGGQVKINFPVGSMPPEFGLDKLVKDIRVKPALTSFGLMLAFINFVK